MLSGSYRFASGMMKTLTGIILLSILGGTVALGYTNLGNNTFQTDGSSSDVQAAINAAANGYTVLIPAGNFTWSSGITISNKAIRMQGTGAGALLGNSTTSVSVGTGSKTFSTQSGLPLQPGQTVIAYYTASGMAGRPSRPPHTNSTASHR